ncbi:unnamed protein product [Rangifer tarandus platyrhynchus]|uniref:Uncharacterized protein n=2 Tax=Rangifer tarandus platyrhynchus TaxID=3082113 RepID=A0AC59Z798_RANTA|nr:unnamed protein product [Rangifer tarandus platyrhynchus]
MLCARPGTQLLWLYISAPRPHRRAAGDMAGGLRHTGWGWISGAGSFSLDASTPLGFFLWAVGLVVERPKANFESRGGHLLVKCLWLETLGETWFSPGMMNHRRCLLRESARSDIDIGA